MLVSNPTTPAPECLKGVEVEKARHFVDAPKRTPLCPFCQKDSRVAPQQAFAIKVRQGVNFAAIIKKCGCTDLAPFKKNLN